MIVVSIECDILYFFFFFFNDTATTEIYTLSLHDALPISSRRSGRGSRCCSPAAARRTAAYRSEEHTSELQSQSNLVCRLLLEKKKTQRCTLFRLPSALSFRPYDTADQVRPHACDSATT